jgi:Zn-dependent protease with chaperone function
MTFHSAGRHLVVLTFMGLVTSAVLALLIVEVAKGLDGVAGIAVYGVTAGFGLDFVSRSWAAHWAERGDA